jgi:hypothetical protein
MNSMMGECAMSDKIEQWINWRKQTNELIIN